METAGQIVSIIAMSFNILAMQNKTKRGIIAFELCGTALFATSYFLLESYVGAMLNLVGVLRSIIFLNETKLNSTHPLWLMFFESLYITSYVLNFTVFGVEFNTYNLIIGLLPVIGMTVGTLGYRMKNAKGTRRFGIARTSTWLIYNISVRSIGAIICEVLSTISVVTAIIRLDIKHEKPQGEAAEEEKEAQINS